MTIKSLVFACLLAATPLVSAYTTTVPTTWTPSMGYGYTLGISSTQKCLDADIALDNNVEQWKCGTNSTKQIWTLSSPGHNSKGGYRLKNVASGLCLDASGTTSGVGLIHTSCSAVENNQLWKIDASGSGTYKIVNVANALCVTSNTTAGSGAVATQATCAGSTGQMWQFTQKTSPQRGNGVWPEKPDGFSAIASSFVPAGTTGGAGGETVTVTTHAELKAYAEADDTPLIIKVQGVLTAEPFGYEIRVKSNKSIIGVGTTAHIVGGGFFLAKYTRNIIIRNLVIRDAYVEGDYEGKTQDYDAIQMDTADHIWIDHNLLTHMGDGLIDSRLDTSYLTVSWNILSNHNKAFGLGWTENVTAEVSIHHNIIDGTYQRNPSVDNVLRAHLYNNYLNNVTSYGNNCRGKSNMVIENSYYSKTIDPFYIDSVGTLRESGSIVVNSSWGSGRVKTGGNPFTPSSNYTYTLDQTVTLPTLLKAWAGPQANIGL